MTFLHETLYTKSGNDAFYRNNFNAFTDAVGGSYPAGSVVSMINTFRSELFLPERLQYNWIKFTTSSPAKIEFQTVEGRQISVTKEQMPQLDKQIRRSIR